jgi:tetratricopeptide (TPR) repeat protein
MAMAPATAPAFSPSPSQHAPAPTIVDEKPQWLVPAKKRSEAEQDHVEALSLFSAARIRENRQDYAGALQLYERAFRRDPRSATTARAIVPLAVRLDRHAEAVRYALKVVELEPPDPQLLKRLGVYLAQTGDWPKALALYEKAAAARSTAKPAAEDVALWMEMGRLYHLTDQYAKAAASFSRVIDALDHPDRYGLTSAVKKALMAEPGPTYALMGDTFLLAGEPQKAAVAFEKSNQAAPSNGLLGYRMAKVDLKTGKPEQALQRLQAYFDARLSSEEFFPCRLLADILKALKKENELLPRLEKLHASDPNNVWLAYALAEKCFEAQKLDQAEKLYRALAAKKPSVLGYRNLIEIYRRGKRYDDLVKVLGEAVAKLSALEPLATNKRALADDAELVRGAIEAARKQLAKDPKALGYEPRVAVALLAADAKQWDAAGEFFDLAMRAKPDQSAKLLLAWGRELLSRDEAGRAVKVFQRGIDQKALPADDPAFYFYLAGALEMSGQTDPAVAAARKAAELAQKQQGGLAAAKRREAKGELPRYLSRVAWILYHAKRYDEARKAYGEIVEKYKRDYGSGEVRAVVRECRIVLSNIAVLRGDIRGAEEWLEQVLDEFPDDPSALNDLGYLWADEGKHLHRAERMIRQAVQQEPSNAAYRDSLGWVLFRLGKIREALPELEKAASMEPDPTVLEHLGDAYRANGQADKARQWWRKAAEAYRKAHEEDKAKNVEKKVKPAP